MFHNLFMNSITKGHFDCFQVLVVVNKVALNIYLLDLCEWASLVAPWLKNPLANAGDKGLIPWLERSLKKEMATHSRILAWRILWTEEPGRL